MALNRACLTLACVVQIGDYAILIRSGFSTTQAIRSQFLTSLGGLAGACFGLMSADAEQEALWILPFTVPSPPTHTLTHTHTHSHTHTLTHSHTHAAGATTLRVPSRARTCFRPFEMPTLLQHQHAESHLPQRPRRHRSTPFWLHVARRRSGDAVLHRYRKDADLDVVCDLCRICVRGMSRPLIRSLRSCRAGRGLPVHLIVFADSGHVRAGDRRVLLVA